METDITVIVVVLMVVLPNIASEMYSNLPKVTQTGRGIFASQVCLVQLSPFIPPGCPPSSDNLSSAFLDNP